VTETLVPGRIVPVPGKGILKIAGVLLLILALPAFVFGLLGLARVDITGTLYLESAITDAMSIPEVIEVMHPVTGDVSNQPIWTSDSWDALQSALGTARITAADGVAPQAEIDAIANNLRDAIAALVLTDIHADTDSALLLPAGHTRDVFFIFMLVFAAFHFICGMLNIKFSGDVKKARILGTLSVIGTGLTLALFFSTASTLGYTFAWMMLAVIIVPMISAAGARCNDRQVDTVIIFGILILLSCVVLFPLWWIIRSSLMTLTEVSSMAFFPSRWLFSNYALALENFHFFLYLRNTLTIAVPAVILGTGTSVLCGYSFARFHFRGKKFVFALCIASMLLPPMVTMIPIFIVWTSFFDMANSFFPLILPWVCGGGAFNIFLMRQFILTIPREMDEAAMIDGAGRLRILLLIILPSIKPAVMVVSIFIFMHIWNDILTQTIYLSDPSMATMALGLRVFSGSFGTVWNLTMVAAVLAIIPGILIYIIGQKYLVEGIVMTGMKN